MIETEPTKEAPGEENWKFPFHDRALQLAKENAPDQSSEIATLLDAVDAQGVANLRTITDRETGSSFPITHVSVNIIAQQLRGNNTSANEHLTAEIPSKRIIYVINQGWSDPAVGMFTPWDMVYDSATKLLRRSVRSIKKDSVTTHPPQVDIFIPGSPHSKFGKVGLPFLREVHEKGFAAHGRLYSQPIIDQITTSHALGQDVTVILHGMSMGGPVSQEMARVLKDYFSQPKFREKPKLQIQVLLDNPAGLHKRSEWQTRGLQIPVGFLQEASMQKKDDKKLKAGGTRNMFAEAYQFDAALTRQVAEKLRPEADSARQKILKLIMPVQEVIRLVRGTPLEPGMHALLRRGLFDPTGSTDDFRQQVEEFMVTYFESPTEEDPRGNLKQLPFFKVEETRTLRVPIPTSHGIDRLRILRWAKRIKKTLEVMENQT